LFAFPLRATSLSSVVKSLAALAFIPLLLFLAAGCEEHPVSDLQKVDPAALASPAPR